MSDVQPFQSAPPSKAAALINPFYYVAGWPALGIGLLVILAAGLIGSFSNTHFDGVLDVHSGRPAALWFFLVAGLIDWLAIALPLYVAGLILSRSRGVRAIDVFGTQALARAPSIFNALLALMPGFQQTIRAFAEITTRLAGVEKDPVQLSILVREQILAWIQTHYAEFTVFLVVVIFSLVIIVWMVVLMYRAYSVSCNVKGTAAVVSFIVALIIAEVVSGTVIFNLIAYS